MPQYASVQKPPLSQQADQFLARIQQSTHCRNCKYYYKFSILLLNTYKNVVYVQSEWTSPIIS